MRYMNASLTREGSRVDCVGKEHIKHLPGDDGKKVNIWNKRDRDFYHANNMNQGATCKKQGFNTCTPHLYV